MNRLVFWYNKHFKQKLFNKILMLYSIITILSLATLSGFVYTYLVNTQVQKELDLNKQVLNSIASHLDEKHLNSQEIIQEIYREGSSTLLDDINSFLQKDYSNYLNDRLLQYINSGVRTPNIITFLRLQLSNNPDIRTIAMYSADKKSLYLLTQKTQNYYEINTDLQTALEKYIITEKSITTVSNITSMNKLDIVGNLIIDYDTEGIYQSFQNNRNEMKGYVVVLTPEGKTVFDSSGRYYGQKYPYASLLGSTSFNENLEDGSFVNSQMGNRFGFWIAGVIPKSEIIDDLKGLRNTLLLVTGVCIAGAMFLTYFTLVSYSRRTSMIVKAMKRLQDGDLSVRVPMEKQDELFQISSRFNRMCEDLTQYIDQVYKSEIRQKHAELVALQAQINPHFLYNTLEAIRMRALHKKADDVGEMIYLLATMFRYSVNSNTVVTLSDEMEYCRLYLDLFRIRYKNNFTYELDIEPEWMNVPILKLSIQPIIENYVVHGLIMSHSDNQLWVNAALEGDDLLITIRDNGSGIKHDKLEQLKSRLIESPLHATGSIGLINVNERIKVFFGTEYGLHIESTSGQGTLIILKIPAGKGGQSLA